MKATKLFVFPAILAALTFASCSDYDNGFTEKQIRYEQAFHDAFGDIDPAQDWNLVRQLAEKGTRTAYPNGNMWASESWVVPDPLEDCQKYIVRRFFQENKEPKGIAINFSDFFVQQVYRGGDNPGSNSPEKYKAADGQNDIIPGDHMDYLTAGSNHDHINNFNGGTGSAYGNVQDNNLQGFHSDEIMLMVDSQTDCFGYWNSEGSYGHDDRYVIVSGDMIEEWARVQGIEWCKCESAHSLRGRFFVGFDFDMVPEKKLYTGSYLEVDGVKYPYISDNRNTYCGEFETMDEYSEVLSYLQSGKDPKQDGKERLTERIERAKYLLSQGYLPTQNNGFVKVGGCNDGYYSDWIVSITPGMMRGTLESALLVCEDLGDYDFDFNDIVLQLDHIREINADNTQSDKLVITAMAAGGTLPSYVYYKPLRSQSQHTAPDLTNIGDEQETWEWLWDWKAFADDDNGMTNGIHHMTSGNEGDLRPLNVGAKPQYKGYSWEKDITGAIEVIRTSPDPNIQKYINNYVSYLFDYSRIQVCVGDPDSTKATVIRPIQHGYNENEDASNYYLRNTPQMMLLPLTYQWARERVFIGEAYPDFTDWVRNKDNADWWRNPAQTNYITLRDGVEANGDPYLQWADNGGDVSISANDGKAVLTYTTSSTGRVSIHTDRPDLVEITLGDGKSFTVKGKAEGTATITLYQQSTDKYYDATITRTVIVGQNASNEGENTGGGDNSGNGEDNDGTQITNISYHSSGLSPKLGNDKWLESGYKIPASVFENYASGITLTVVSSQSANIGWTIGSDVLRDVYWESFGEGKLKITLTQAQVEAAKTYGFQFYSQGQISNLEIRIK